MENLIVHILSEKKFQIITSINNYNLVLKVLSTYFGKTVSKFFFFFLLMALFLIFLFEAFQLYQSVSLHSKITFVTVMTFCLLKITGYLLILSC